LLCYGVKLFENQKVVDWCRHVLVDELWVLGGFLASDSDSYDQSGYK
jgi:hypothetical protein